jgi:hypothetical protein
MADIQCVNPVCQRANPDTKTFCIHCGWRLPKPEPSVAGSQDIAALQGENLQLKQQNAQLLAGQQAQQQQLARTTEAHQQLQVQHDQLKSAHQDLTQQHQQATATLTAAQQQLADAEALKQEAEGKVQALQAQIEAIPQGSATSPQAESEIARLGSLLATAQKDLAIAVAKVKAFEASPIGKETWPLRSKILSWGLAAIVGLGGGTALGVFSPLNTSKKQAATTQNDDALQKQNLASVQEQLTKTKQDLDKATQDGAALQQSNAQLNAQIESLNKGSQTATKQTAAVQAQLTAAKAETAKEHAAMLAVEQEVQAEKARNQQLSEKAARVAALEAVIAAHPTLNYKGPTQGTITIRFNGKSDKPASIVMDHFNASPDSSIRVESVIGAQMPGVPVLVEPVSRNVSIASPPNAANGWQKMTLTVQGKGSNQAVLKWSVF